MNKRYVFPDLMRAIALFLVMIYHGWVLEGQPRLPGQFAKFYIQHGGEIGVTAFFVLSGFGITLSLIRNEEKHGRVALKEFYKGRVIRIVPNYYFALFLVIILSSTQEMITKFGLKNIVLHLVFLHNWDINTHGGIITVLWTMGTIVQFYVLAPFIYKAVKRFPVMSAIASIAIAIGTQCVLFHYIIPAYSTNPGAYFVYSREVITALDNFVLGMSAAVLIKKVNYRNPVFLMGLLVMLVLIPVWSYIGANHGIYSDNVSGYVWHSGLAIILTFMMCFGILSGIGFNSSVFKPILFVAANEYGIYIYHYEIMRLWIAREHHFQIWMQGSIGKVIVLLIVTAISILFGTIIGRLVDGFVLSNKK